MGVMERIAEELEKSKGQETTIKLTEQEYEELLDAVPFLAYPGFKWTLIAGVLHVEKE